MELIIRALIFRQDYRINKIFLPFRPPDRRPERQKVSSIFKERRLR